MRRMCRVKNPWFWVEKDGYPLAPWFLILDDSHATEPPPMLAGLDRPLLMFKPGLDQPPPGTGDGLLESVIPGTGVPIARREYRD